MAASLFERTLTTAEMEAVFDDRALVGAMLELEAALADAEGAESVIPAAAAQAIGAACGSEDFDIEAIVVAARQAGTIVVPLVEQLKALANACAGLEVDTARMRGNVEAHLRAVAAVDANAAPVDVDAEARHAGALAEVQLDALQRQREEPFK
jgi:adenylosuccinate lyase